MATRSSSRSSVVKKPCTRKDSQDLAKSGKDAPSLPHEIMTLVLTFLDHKSKCKAKCVSKGFLHCIETSVLEATASFEMMQEMGRKYKHLRSLKLTTANFCQRIKTLRHALPLALDAIPSHLSKLDVSCIPTQLQTLDLSGVWTVTQVTGGKLPERLESLILDNTRLESLTPSMCSVKVLSFTNTVFGNNNPAWMSQLAKGMWHDLDDSWKDEWTHVFQAPFPAHPPTCLRIAAIKALPRLSGNVFPLFSSFFCDFTKSEFALDDEKDEAEVQIVSTVDSPMLVYWSYQGQRAPAELVAAMFRVMCEVLKKVPLNLATNDFNGDNGVRLCRHILRTYSDNTEVCHEACTFLSILLRSPENRATYNDLDMMKTNVEVLQKHSRNRGATFNICDSLANALVDINSPMRQKFADCGGLSLSLEVLRMHGDDAECAFEMSRMCLNALAGNRELQKTFGDIGAIEILLHVLERSGIRHAEAGRDIVWTLIYIMYSHQEHRKRFFRCDGVSKVLKLIKNQGSNVHVARYACWCLAISMDGNPDNQRVFAEQKGHCAIVDIIRNHLLSPETMRYACEALYSSMAYTESQRIFASEGGVEAVIPIFQHHTGNVLTMQFACLAVCCALDGSMENARSFYNARGLRMICLVMHYQIANPEVLRFACSIITNITSDCAEARVSLRENGGIEMLVEILSTHRANVELVAHILRALWNSMHEDVENQRRFGEANGFAFLEHIMVHCGANVPIMCEVMWAFYYAVQHHEPNHALVIANHVLRQQLIQLPTTLSAHRHVLIPTRLAVEKLLAANPDADLGDLRNAFPQQ